MKEKVLNIVTLIILAVTLVYLAWQVERPAETDAEGSQMDYSIQNVSKTDSDGASDESETKLTREEADVLAARTGTGRWEEAYEPTPDHVDQEMIDDEISEHFDLFCDVVFAENGNQGDKGLRLAADTIINRMRNGEKFNDTMYAVLTAPNQFSCISDGGAAKWHGHTREHVRKICQEELADTTYTNVYYFRTGHYGYGKQLFKYKDVYYSGI